MSREPPYVPPEHFQEGERKKIRGELYTEFVCGLFLELFNKGSTLSSVRNCFALGHSFPTPPSYNNPRPAFSFLDGGG